MFVFSCTGTYEHRREKICLWCVCENAHTQLHKPASILKYLIYINNKGADEPAWIGGLVSDIVVLLYQRAFFSRRGLHKYELCYENNYLCLYAKNKNKKKTGKHVHQCSLVIFVVLFAAMTCASMVAKQKKSRLECATGV